MKKLIAMILVLGTMLIMMVSCYGKPEAEDTPKYGLSGFKEIELEEIIVEDIIVEDIIIEDIIIEVWDSKTGRPRKI